MSYFDEFQRSAIDAWSVSALIPDNPEARARGKFTYGQKRDAFSYGWCASNEMLEVVAVILDAINGRAGVESDAQQRAAVDKWGQRDLAHESWTP